MEMVDGYMIPFEAGEILSIDGSKDEVYDITLEPVINLVQPVNETVIQEDHFDLEWEPVKDASYYLLEFTIEKEGASYSVKLDNRITSHKTTIELEDLYALSTNFILNEQDTKEDFFLSLLPCSVFLTRKEPILGEFLLTTAKASCLAPVGVIG